MMLCLSVILNLLTVCGLAVAKVSPAIAWLVCVTVEWGGEAGSMTVGGGKWMAAVALVPWP